MTLAACSTGPSGLVQSLISRGPGSWSRRSPGPSASTSGTAALARAITTPRSTAFFLVAGSTAAGC